MPGEDDCSVSVETGWPELTTLPGCVRPPWQDSVGKRLTSLFRKSDCTSACPLSAISTDLQHHRYPLFANHCHPTKIKCKMDKTPKQTFLEIQSISKSLGSLEAGSFTTFASWAVFGSLGVFGCSSIPFHVVRSAPTTDQTLQKWTPTHSSLKSAIVTSTGPSCPTNSPNYFL